MSVRTRLLRGRRSLRPGELVALIARRVSWGLADQAVSSLTNFAVGIVAARSLGAADFGAFSLVWVSYTLVLNIARGLATDPLVVRFSGDPDDRWRDAVRSATGASLTVGVAAGLLAAVGGLLLGGPVGTAFVALGIVTPGLLLQDSWRFAFFSSGTGQRAFVNDLVWAVALVPTLLVAALHPTVFAFVLAWGGAATVAALVGWAQSRLRPHPRAMPRWLRSHRDLGLRYLLENICLSGAAQIRMYGLGAVAGLASVGTVRGGELLVGPFLALLMGLNMVAVPEASRIVRDAPRRLPQFCLSLGGVQMSAAFCWGLGLLFLLPDSVGRSLLGQVWPAASALIVPASLAAMNTGFSAGPSAGLRALGAAALSLRTQLVTSVLYVTFGVTGAVLGGALGSSWGVAIATGLGAVLWWVHLRIGLRRHLAAVADGAVTTDIPVVHLGTPDDPATVVIPAVAHTATPPVPIAVTSPAHTAPTAAPPEIPRQRTD